MKIRRIIILLIVLLMSIAFGNIVYAANEATLTLTPTAESYKQGDEATLKVSVTNTGIESGISVIAGVFEYDNTAIELVAKDIAELTEEQQMIIEILATEIGFVEVLSVTDNYVLLVTEGNLIVMNIGDKIAIGKTEEVGEIKFQILSSAVDGKIEIKLTSVSIEEEYTMQDVISNIFIGEVPNGANNSNKPDNEPNKPNDKDGNTQTPAGTNKDVEDKEDKQKKEEEKSDQAKQDIVYTGAEDVIPFIAIILIIAIVSYIKYRKYKCI